MQETPEFHDLKIVDNQLTLQMESSDQITPVQGLQLYPDHSKCPNAEGMHGR